MKRMFFLLIAATEALSANAQTAAPAGPATKPLAPSYATDDLLSRWVIDINGKAGTLSENVNTAVSADNYDQSIKDNTKLGTASFKGKTTFGVDGQLGFFVGKGRHWGLGAGFMYLKQNAEASLDQFHVEYKSTDANGNVFRQMVTGNSLTEKLDITNMNIPVVLKYKNRFSKVFGFTADAGVLLNMKMTNKYTTSANFDYEAVYAYSGDVAVYDGNPTPDSKSFLLTKAAYTKFNSGGDVNAYFADQKAKGYNVGLAQSPTTKDGEVSYKTGSVGFILQPALNIFLSDHVALNIGAYYIYQSFDNTPASGYQLTNKIGDYSSVLNTVSTSTNQSVGGNVGLRFFLGKKAAQLIISSTDMVNPSYCGLCDGSFTLNGLFPNKEVTVTYNMNGTPQTPVTAMTTPEGKVKIANLCAGAYTEIVAKIGRQHASSAPVTLANPPLNINQRSANPTVPDGCDGSITIGGLRAGESATVTYSVNGKQTPFNGVPGGDNTVTLSGLCGGSYSNITVSTKGCSAKGRDVTLTAPTPPPPPPAPVVELDMSTPILFEVNKTVVDESSFPIIDVAARAMKLNTTSEIVIEGHTDNTGSVAYNQKLSVRRAAAVKKELVKRGGDAKRIKAVGYGPKNPVATNNTPEGRKMNRRVIMRLKEKNKN